MVNLDYLYNPDAAKPIVDKNYFVDKKLGFQVIEHGMILPHKNFFVSGWPWGGGGVFYNDGTFVKDSYECYRAGQCYPLPSAEQICHSSETVVYLDVFGNCWGNILAEYISRLWFLKKDVFKMDFKNCRLVYVPRCDFNLNTDGNKNFRRLLDILELNFDSLYAITQPTQFEKVIFPDLSLFYNDESKIKTFTSEYRETIDRVRDFAIKNRTPTSSKKVYYFHGQRAFGEKHIAEYFESKGYLVVSPEKLTLDEQLNLLINCESFASNIGSCSHNSVFLNDNTEVILIPRANNLFTNYQELLNQVHNLNVNYVDSTLSFITKNNGNFLYIVSPQLKRFFGDKFNGYDEEDFKTFLQYVKDCMGRGLTINPSAKDYYAPILEEFMAQLKQHEDLIAACDMPLGWEKFRSLVSYQIHVDSKGWREGWKNEKQISGSTEDKLDIQAVKINFPNHNVYYSVYYNAEEGWSEEVSNGEQAGTTGKSKAIYGIKIRLDETGQKEFDILYRLHKFDGEWTDWAKNGETLYSYGQKLNALQIKLEPKT